MKNKLILVFFVILFIGCEDSSSKKNLFGYWVTSLENSNQYDNKILKIAEPTDELKSDKAAKWAGVYKIAYLLDSAIVEDSVVTGKWKYISIYDSTKGGFVNSFELTPDTENALPVLREFYFDGQVLSCLNRSGDVITVENYYEMTTQPEDF